MSNRIVGVCAGAARQSSRSLRSCHSKLGGARSRVPRRFFGNVPPRTQMNLAYKTADNEDMSSVGSQPISNKLSPLGQVKQLDLNPLWLRDICSCEHCVDSSSGQKTFWTVEIPHNVRVKDCVTNDKGELVYSWENDVPGAPKDHVTKVQPQAILDALYGPRSLAELKKVAWSVDTLELLEVDYEDYINNSATFRKALIALQKYGLLFVKNVPESEQSVINLAERIGPLKNTFYGFTWDVKVVPQAKNVAYTSGYLGFHQDLLYMKDPPRLQLLHCLRTSAAGGASLFSDGFKACVDVYNSDRTAFDDLCTLKTKFHYIKDGKHYTQSRPMIERDPSSDSDLPSSLKAINWSPPFQGPFTAETLQGDIHRIKRWHEAANTFRAASEDPKNVFERMMKPGECVIFDNQRVLHARTAFEPGDAGKERWLKGCYTDADPLWSAWRVAAGDLGEAELD